MTSTLTRRRALQLFAAAGAAACSRPRPRSERASDDGGPMHDTPPATPTPTTMSTRPIPRTGELVPAIGLGTWQTFDVGDGAAERAPLAEVLKRFLAAGGRVIDSSPMYGRAEEVTGDLIDRLGAIGTPFLATKVWTTGRARGIEEMERSMRRMRTARMDLMQVHNLQDVDTHLPVLRDWKAQGVIRYLGVTHYAASAFDAIERLMRTGDLDFIQIPYSVLNRRVEERILPAAIDTRTAVLVMMPFESGELFARVKGRAVPPWAGELDCTSWSQLFLKFLLGHPAVTCPLPATSNPRHLDDNVGAGRGRVPDEAERRRIVEAVG